MVKYIFLQQEKMYSRQEKNFQLDFYHKTGALEDKMFTCSAQPSGNGLGEMCHLTSAHVIPRPGCRDSPHSYCRACQPVKAAAVPFPQTQELSCRLRRCQKR